MRHPQKSLRWQWSDWTVHWHRIWKVKLLGAAGLGGKLHVIRFQCCRAVRKASIIETHGSNDMYDTLNVWWSDLDVQGHCQHQQFGEVISYFCAQTCNRCPEQPAEQGGLGWPERNPWARCAQNGVVCFMVLELHTSHHREFCQQNVLRRQHPQHHQHPMGPRSVQWQGRAVAWIPMKQFAAF